MEPLSMRPGCVRQERGVAFGTTVGVGVREGIGVKVDGISVDAGWMAGEQAEAARRRERRRIMRNGCIFIMCLTGYNPSHYTRPVTELISGCSAVGSALALGARGPGFKSRHPDLLRTAISFRYGGIFLFR